MEDAKMSGKTPQKTPKEKLAEALIEVEAAALTRGRIEAMVRLGAVLSWTAGAIKPYPPREKMNQWVLELWAKTVEDFDLPKNSVPRLEVEYFQSFLKGEKE
jgi:hypothetical protein